MGGGAGAVVRRRRLRRPRLPAAGAGRARAHRLDGLVALPDDLLDLPQHCHLGVLQLLLLRLGVRHARAVRGHGFVRLRRGTEGAR